MKRLGWLLSLLAAAPFAAAQFQQTPVSGGGAGNTQTYLNLQLGQKLTPGSTLVVVAQAFNGGGAITISVHDQGHVWVSAVNDAYGGCCANSEVFIAPNLSNATDMVEIEAPGGDVNAILMELPPGISLVSPLDGTNHAVGGSSPVATGSITTTGSSDTLISYGTLDYCNCGAWSGSGGWGSPAATWAGSSYGSIGVFVETGVGAGTYSNTVATSAGSNVRSIHTGILALKAAGAYSISGNVATTVKNTLVQAVDGSSNVWGSAWTDASGNYTISGIPNGSYTVTPTCGIRTFSPTSASVTISGGNSTGNNFTASASNACFHFEQSAPVVATSATTATIPLLSLVGSSTVVVTARTGGSPVVSGCGSSSWPMAAGFGTNNGTYATFWLGGLSSGACSPVITATSGTISAIASEYTGPSSTYALETVATNLYNAGTPPGTVNYETQGVEDLLLTTITGAGAAQTFSSSTDTLRGFVGSGYNASGVTLATFDRVVAPGSYSSTLNASPAAAGSYIYGVVLRSVLPAVGAVQSFNCTGNAITVPCLLPQPRTTGSTITGVMYLGSGATAKVSTNAGDTCKILSSVQYQVGFTCAGGSSGSVTVTATTAAGVSAFPMDIFGVEVIGASSTFPVAQSTANNYPGTQGAISSWPIGTMVVPPSSPYLYSCAGGNVGSAGAGVTPGSGWISRNIDFGSTANIVKCWDQIVSGAGSYSNTLTLATAASGLYGYMLALATVPQSQVRTVQSQQAGNAPSYALDNAVTSGNTLLAYFKNNGAGVVGVASSGDSWSTLFGGGSSDNYLVSLAVGASGTSGWASKTVTFSGYSTYFGSEVLELTPGTLRCSGAATPSTASSITTPSCTPAIGDYLVAGCGASGSSTFNNIMTGTTSGWTLRQFGTGDNFGLNIYDQRATSTSAVSQTCTNLAGSGQDLDAWILDFTPTSASANQTIENAITWLDRMLAAPDLSRGFRLMTLSRKGRA